MRSTNVRHHYREGGKVSVTQHTRNIEERPEREKYEKPEWAKLSMDERENILMGESQTKERREKRQKLKNDDWINSEKLNENEVNLIKRRLNDKKLKPSEIERINNGQGYALTQEQHDKAKNWLKSLYLTPKGKEKEDSPMGWREQQITEHMKEIRVKDFYDDANYYQAQAGIKNYVPLYEVISEDGDTFEYYYNNGKINIVG